VGQVAIYVVHLQQPEILDNAQLIPQLVWQGEVWRLVTFLFVPPATAFPIFLFFFWYLFYLMGTVLEQQWGVFRYNVFLLIGYVATTAVSFLTPEAPSSNVFLQGSVFLAFAALFPDFVLNLFFILPVKVKWLALVAWIGYLFRFVFGDWQDRLLVLASVANVFLFFGRELWSRVRQGQRRMAWQAKVSQDRNKPRHRCMVCGITSVTHPKMQFRYCSKCVGQCGYCTEHVHNHEHVTEPVTEP
jgi:hypothetical protein